MSKQETIAADIANAFASLIAQLNSKKDAAGIIKRTTLQAGIHDLARFVYKNGEMFLYSSDDDFSDADMHYEGLPPADAITDEKEVAAISALLPAQLQAALTPYDNLPIIDFKFVVTGEIIIGKNHYKITPYIHISEPKKQHLLTQIEKYLHNKIYNGKYPTKNLETFFLARHLVDPLLYPTPDYQQITRIFDQIIDQNKNNKEEQKQHRYYINNALNNWAENYFLPQFYDITKIGYQSPTYQLKQEYSKPEPAALDMLLYIATAIIRYEPNYSRPGGITFVNLAKELGSTKAATLLQSGTGKFTPHTSAAVKITPNDVFATIDIQILQEDAPAYMESLSYLQNLLSNGFPRSYSIVLKSKQKHFLPVKGLAKNSTHRFFANTLQYPALFASLETYARLAMSVPFQWYEDAEAEYCCMPGTYAVFGLGLTDTAFFPLVKDYMPLVDSEHQSVQNHFTIAFIEKHGTTPAIIPVITACLLACQDMKPVKQLATLAEESLNTMLEALQEVPSYQVEQVISLIWGSKEKLATIAKKKNAAPQLQALLQLAAD
ncbi:DUF6138 family protein [Chitinophaga sp. Cy-1792]|uniref:DUF6138 family protein n=1 Tax=Chitinophaga sp. Cy-1792 TaxID=2608339 RepID=UPI00141ED941|nr:DUF6138 family protein [Chitinophaga sp. Cy-1792]NIG54401.1 hypothetical protein [Chitinophaga sp. Cy-1792]